MAYDEDLAARVRDCVQAESGLSEQKMFGGLAFLINGHIAVAASGQGACCCASTQRRPTRWHNGLTPTGSLCAAAR